MNLIILLKTLLKMWSARLRQPDVMAQFLSSWGLANPSLSFSPSHLKQRMGSWASKIGLVCPEWISENDHVIADTEFAPGDWLIWCSGRRGWGTVGEGRGQQQPVLEGLHLERLRGRKSGFAVCHPSYHHSVGVKGGNGKWWSASYPKNQLWQGCFRGLLKVHRGLRMQPHEALS